jgi:hypothetical protein
LVTIIIIVANTSLLRTLLDTMMMDDLDNDDDFSRKATLVTPTLTLNISGVDFSLHPETAESAVDFRQDNDNETILLNLKSFTGTLRVRMPSLSTSSNETRPAAVNNITPKTTHVSTSSLLKRSRSVQAPEENEAGDADMVLQVLPQAPPPKKPFRPSQQSQPVVEEEVMVNAHAAADENVDGVALQNALSPSQVTTLLGQPDFSQTQTSFATTVDFDLDDKDEHKTNSNSKNDDAIADQQQQVADNNDDNNQELEPPSTVQKIMMENNKDDDNDDDSESQSSEQSLVSMTEHSPTYTDVISAARPPPARVSLGGSPLLCTKHGVSPPCARWGHAMTPIGGDRILVYGGQTTVASDDEDEMTELKTTTTTTEATETEPRTLQDVYIYDLNLEQWTKPFNCDGMPRQWHTATFLPDRQLLISFGGEAITPATTTTNKGKSKSISQKCKTTDQVMVLDTEIMLWYPPTVSGDVPSGRSGHTATMLSKTNELIVFGGVKGSKWLNTVSCLDTLRWKWRTPKIQGAAPKPRSYHTATALPDNRVVVFGGNDATQSFATVHVLETSPSNTDGGGAEANHSNTKWQWTHPKCMGQAPASRTGHSATLLADKKTICIYGGWDPNSEDDNTDDDEHMIFLDSYLLDIEKWVWRQGPPVVAAASSDENTDFGPKRVGHTAVLSKGGTEVLVFGGRVPHDRFAGDFQRLVVSSSKR